MFLGFGLPSPPTRFSDNVYVSDEAMTASARFSLPRSISTNIALDHGPTIDANFILMKRTRGGQGVLGVFLDFRPQFEKYLIAGHFGGWRHFAPSKAKKAPPGPSQKPRVREILVIDFVMM